MKVYAFMADGTEEVECLSVVDLLRRAKLEVTTVSINADTHIHSAHGVEIVCDTTLAEINDGEAELLFLPGGAVGTQNFKASEKLCTLLKAHAAAGKPLAAICAAPSVFGVLGLLQGKHATCYPGFEGELEGASYTTEGVVRDGQFFTARGLGYALPLGFALIEAFVGAEAAEAMKKAVQYDF